MFRVGIADPAWLFDDKLAMSRVPRGADANYPTLDGEAIKRLPVADVMLPDSVMCVWVPAALLQLGQDTLAAWGFAQKQVWVWVKTKQAVPVDLAPEELEPNDLAFGMGHLARNCDELLLVGTRGKVSRFLASRSERTVFVHPALPHSKKPETIQDALERMFPGGPWLELFARRVRPRWTCLGNEIDGADIRDSLPALLGLPAQSEAHIHVQTQLPEGMRMTRPYVTEVRSTIKGGGVQTLGQRTLLVGANARGKTTRVHGVELALSGEVSDLLGRRTVRDAAMLSTLATPGQPLQAEVKLSDGRSFSYPHAPTFDFPVRQVNAALLGSPETTRKWIMTQLSAGLTEDDVRAAFRAHGTDSALALYTQLGLAGTVAERLEQAIATAQGTAKVNTGMATAKTQAVNNLALHAGAPPSQEELDAARAAVGQGDAYGQVALQVQAAEVAARAAAAAYKHCKVQVEALDGTLAECRQRVAHLEIKVQPADRARRVRMDSIAVVATWLLDRIDPLGTSDTGKCLCGGQVHHQHLQDIRAAAVAEADRLAQLELGVDALNAARKERADLISRRAQLDAERVLARDHADAKIEAWNRLLAQLAQTPDMRSAATYLGQLESRAATWEQINNMRAEAAQLTQTAEVHATFAGVARKVRRALVEKAKDGFVARVRRFEPAFALQIEDEDRNVCRVGLQHDGQIHTALSGAEWVRVHLALGAVVAESLPEDTPVVLIPEERAFDAETLATLMAQLNDAPCQVLLTSTVVPARPVPGWTVIHIDNSEPVTAAEIVPAEKKTRKPRAKKEVQQPTTPAESAPLPFLRTSIDAEDYRRLEALGYNAAMIERMGPGVPTMILDENIPSTGVVVLEDGTLAFIGGGPSSASTLDLDDPVSPTATTETGTVQSPSDAAILAFLD